MANFRNMLCKHLSSAVEVRSHVDVLTVSLIIILCLSSPKQIIR